MVAVIAGSAAIAIAFCAEPLLYAWTGNYELATQAAPILRLYVLGNGCLALAAFPYYLQYALGDLKYHLIGNLITVVVLVPGIIFAASYYGGVGAGYVWLGLNSVILLLWAGYVHRKLVPGLHKDWLLKDILYIVSPAIFVLCIFAAVEPNLLDRDQALACIVISSMVTIIICALMSTYARALLIRRR
ncbi:hypothetical protein D3C78_1191430 [compost metagenome]